ncbi:F-box protein At2g26160-like [Corylus avellana]|uniref:F-box protein At2g26160-like n=1 Tax=Corylus avellana TaxID=13451 RepID=UPI00286C27DD|nr:F-box protein At2g26160-like [Corylus avellana]
MIGRSLDTRIDVLRFRSICSSWRSSIPPFSANPPRFPLQFPDPNTATLTEPPRWPPRLAFLFQTTLYYIQTLNPSTSSSTLSNKGWLMKVDESNSGKLRFVNPVLDSRTRYTITRPKTLNLLNFRVVEYGKAYTLQFQLPINKRRYFPYPFVKKLVVFPNSAWTNADECSIFMIFVDGKLGFAKPGDEKWTLVGESSNYDDVIVYKGQFYVVDKVGIVWWIECSSLKLVQFSPTLWGLGSQKHLVESCGALYVVDKYNDIDDDKKVVGFKVYKLDEELGQWVLVKSLGDQVFVLGADCSFSVPAQEFSGYKGDSILFIDSGDVTLVLVFSLKDHSIHELDSCNHFQRFWPPEQTGLPQANGWVYQCLYT